MAFRKGVTMIFPMGTVADNTVQENEHQPGRHRTTMLPIPYRGRLRPWEKARFKTG